MTLAPAATGPAGDRRDPQLVEFRARCAEAAGIRLDDPAALHAFSVEDPEAFWRTLLTWAELPWSGSADVVLTGDDVETAHFFPDVLLNYAEALLRPLPGVDDDRTALTSVHDGRPAERFGRAQLRTRVQQTATALTGLGLRAGERMVLVAPSTAGAVIAALAGAAVGAAVSTAAPDMGAAALLGRFQQVEPAFLLIDRGGMSEETVRALLTGLPTLRHLLVLDDLPLPVDGPPSHRLAELTATVALPMTPWERHPFDAPLFVMFSSGTTGPPKAMVHGAGGTLLEHVKEHRLHGDLGPDDTLYFHTTTAWMMWNWQLSALAVGAHIVLYDGPVRGPETLWELVAEQGVTVFGTSPAYLQLCQDAGYRPADTVELSRLRAVLSTGAVLHDWQFDWVAGAVGPVPLQSISGGTDIIGCFVLGSPELPVRTGRSQTRSLGLDVAAVDEDGREVFGEIGELVCRRPFPSRPVGFLRDPDGARFHASYFAEHPGMWTHGDLVEFDTDGSARLHGRSDGILNIDGVRIGPGEIYTVLRGLPEIADAMAVEQRDTERPGGSRMVLLVVLRPGADLGSGLDRTIRRTLRREASAAHVPALVVAVPELPLTHNGKRSERAARDAVNGDRIVNADALRNPGCLDAIRAAVDTGGSRSPEQHGEDPVLRVTARIWCEALGVAQADPDDDFSDLGGTSRLALSLLRRVRLDLGVDVPVQDFALRPTLGGLAQSVAAVGSSDVAKVPVLRPGHGRPVFLVPDAWGQLNLYAGLVERLGTERPVLGLHLPLIDADGRHKAIEEVATEALTQVRRVQPDGPYSLIGYSFGGLVAYEMALALRAAGAAVSYLGLLDVRPPEAALSLHEIAARRRAARLKSLLTGKVFAAVGRRLRGLTATGTPPVLRTPDAEHRFFLGSEEVSNAYRPGRFDGAVTYFLAEGSRHAVCHTLSAWRRRVQRLEVIGVPGHHGDLDDERIGMLSDRHVSTLAAGVSATLR
jgi:acetoacetyl-CoA synthetase